MIKYYLVGGAVRDKLMNLKPKDLDYSVEAESFEAMRADIIARGGTIFLETPQYFTIRAKMPILGAADFVLARYDGQYTDGRRPDEVKAGTILEDLARRDFSVNAIAENVDTGEIVDPYNGRENIINKIISCVRNAEDRFTEDSLRMLRAIRFSITKGFTMDDEIISCLTNPNLVNLLDNVSFERIREELFKCFNFNTFETIKTLNNFPLLRDFCFSRGNLILVPTLRSK
jgi:tRNA nucleotidyltransferase (CCA-adding enzyme)